MFADRMVRPFLRRGTLPLLEWQIDEAVERALRSINAVGYEA
jgi:hypothetical protein